MTSWSHILPLLLKNHSHFKLGKGYLINKKYELEKMKIT